MFCRLCGKEIKDGEEYCEACKEEPLLKCPHCNKPITPTDRFCPHCDGFIKSSYGALGTQNKKVSQPKPKTKRCRSCYSEIDASAFFCPVCNKMADTKPEPPSLSKSRNSESGVKGFLLGLVLGFIGIFLAWCFGNDEMQVKSRIGFLCAIPLYIVLMFLTGGCASCAMYCK